MKDIIYDLTLLAMPAEPVTLLKDTGLDETQAKETIKDLQEVFNANPDINALAATQLGINQRIFGIRFTDTIKYFINPVVTKKEKYEIAPETFSSMPGKEILTARPKELTAVYETATSAENAKYEENKFLDAAAKIFDQMAQLLDGITPNEIGLVSDVKEDGSLYDATPEEMTEYVQIYKKFIEVKTKSLQEEISSNEIANQHYKQLKFSEDVINGRIQVVEPEKKQNVASSAATKRIKDISNNENLKSFLGRKH